MNDTDKEDTENLDRANEYAQKGSLQHFLLKEWEAGTILEMLIKEWQQELTT